MIAERSIQQVFDAIDIIDIVSQSVILKRKGANWSGLCPFHNEATPSFSVSEAKNIYKCFGCGESGGGIKFLMEHKKMDYVEAIKYAADLYNITLEETNDNRTPEERATEAQRHTTAIELISTAAKRYNRQLVTHPDINRYLLADRKLTPSTILEWQLGFAPSSDFLYPDIAKAMKQTIAEDVNLIKVTADKMWDVHYNRITIPIINHQGNNVGIASRKLATDTNKDNPKYRNPTENFVYSKGRTLFGLYQAITSKGFKTHGCAILTEGYLDVICMHQENWNNTVATCGTALTPEQAKLLKRHTDTVVIMRDGDEAGLKATKRDIEILLQHGFNTYVVILPTGCDADDMSRKTSFVGWMVSNIKDAFLLRANQLLSTATDDISKARAMDEVAKLLALVGNETQRIVYSETVSKAHGLKAKLKPILDRAIKQKLQSDKDDEEKRQLKLSDIIPKDRLPKWVKREELTNNGFAQLHEPRDGDEVGIYFQLANDAFVRVTNFTITPLYHIPEQNNNRRLIMIDNGRKKAVVEMESRAFISLDVFLTECIKKGSFTQMPHLTKQHFVRIIGWLSEEMPHCHELKTLGWQSEGFFAFSNKVIVPNDDGINEMDYNELGIVQVDGKHYISMGASSINSDQRAEDNIYENDMFLSYKHTTVTFEEWADKFGKVYGDNAPFGIAYIFISLFKDVVTAVTKCPILYSYGPKGSGKSEFCESIMYVFFSGKTSDGKLIQGYNLNPGQGTPFSFWNLQERYRNCVIHFNEFDENNIEDWKFGAMKSFYDGQGREVGDGSTGKARKTKIQKTQSTLVVAGQYLSTRDDGSVLSRSITCQFNSSRVDNLTQKEVEDFQTLKKWEDSGLSMLVAYLLQFKKHFKAEFNNVYWEINTTFGDDVRKKIGNAETRLIRNYTCILAALKVMGKYVKLPMKYETLYNQCLNTVITHNSLLKDNNSLSMFWAGVEFLTDRKEINYDKRLDKRQRVEYKIHTVSDVSVKTDGKVSRIDFPMAKKVLFIRFPLVYAVYAHYHRTRHGKPPQDESTLLKYMQDQPYFIGLCPNQRFDDGKSTSCYMIDYNLANVNLEVDFLPDGLPLPVDSSSSDGGSGLPDNKTDDLPF